MAETTRVRAALAAARNARAEADAQLAAGHVARVLETSPPALTDAFFADDPVMTEVGKGIVVAPVGGDVSWTGYVAKHPELADWAKQRWLLPRRLPEIPAGLAAERIALHRLAAYVIAPARHQTVNRFGLRWTLGGFGTPFFGADRQVRVVAASAGDGVEVVVQDGDDARSVGLSSLNAAAAFIGSSVDPETAAEHDTPPAGDLDETLTATAATMEFLDAWWGMSTAALEVVRSDAASIDASRVQLWPGHFDTAIEAGDETRRSSFGASPGDDGSDHPYLYVSVWWPDRLSLGDDPFWNADGYVGARLGFAELAAADDPVAAAVAFFRSARDRLMAS